ncbi:hypothetical protein [Pacificibacter marinus]|uniref:VWFA domain-containing protein n=1 Tax=Pacificibacter marinus TaxID=658057 RepID=A0A1Y5T398_9RHOB|nr:hypothetical protein [Pacificibacter marinus]SEL00479.1 hypothetical protein SAMN04488032_109146 [Pacificibacter marinus]SLN54794.1 hypothetical protein PAM7971_02837 [Pacificibacter marinus]
MAKRRRTNRNGGSAALKIGSLLLTILALLLASGIVWFLYSAKTQDKIDQVSLCPERGSMGNLVFLIDQTDPVSMTQLTFAKTKVERMINDVQTGTRISIGVVAPNSLEREKSFLSLCKPASEANALTQNVMRVAATYRENFEKPMETILASLMVVSTADSSPIIENLQELLSRVPDFLANEKPTTLVIFSNLAQHSDTLSFYKGDDWDAFTESGAVNRLSRALMGMEVFLLQLPVRETFQPDLENFWARYFDAQGVTSLHYELVGDL